jgi:hypothetical protein
MNGTPHRAAPAAPCPDWDQMIGYFQQNLDTAGMEAIDAHFAVCEKCIETARAAHEYAVALERWTARAHGEAWRRERVGQAMEVLAEEAEPPLADRLRRWGGRLRHSAWGAVQVLVDVSGARLVTEGLADVVRGDGLRFEPVGAVRGEGKSEVREAVAQEGPWRIRAFPDGRVEVSAANRQPGAPPPVLMVIDTMGDRAPLLVPLICERDSVFASFAQPSGSYLLVFFSDDQP